ncbi:MAG: hypothetical protein GY839_09435 [candidate division Zixibacteria bacterium]|nr:hypothetical protein [candidate division Zixibacteria bacterium]
MLSSNASRITTMMIYMGTLLISILSFFTTFRGMNIILSWELALIGSLGLQTAMLGIAWNLIKIKENRSSYVMAFSAAAVFSIFFSYANFDINLKENTRPREARSAYYEAALPVMAEYSSRAKSAELLSRYQVDRVGSLIEMEQEKGWATVIDEGSQDKFIQSIINGARLTVESWRQNTGTEYRQGKGRGIIINYLESRYQQAEKYNSRILEYIAYTDSLALELQSQMEVTGQHDIVSMAFVSFPTSVVGMIKFNESDNNLPGPPPESDFAEGPANTQQALMLVIGDLYVMDRLAFLSLMLAFAIDFIVIAIAFAGSHIMAKSDVILDRIQGDTARRLKQLQLDDIDSFNKILDGNIQAYRKATQYGKDVEKIVEDYQVAKTRLKLVAKSGLTPRHEDPGIKPMIVREKSRLDKWLKRSRSNRREKVGSK